MKKSTIAFVIGAFMLTPFVASAGIIDDLRAQIVSLTETVLNLQIQIAAIINSQTGSRRGVASVGATGTTAGTVSTSGTQNTSTATGTGAATGSTSTAVVSPTSVVVLSPNGGEVFYRGNQNTISWKGGSGNVNIALVKPSASTVADPSGSQNQMVGWISSRGASGNSVSWDGATVCGLEMSACSQVVAGNYKILIVSEDANGNMTIWDNKLNKAGNLDISDIAFTIR